MLSFSQFRSIGRRRLAPVVLALLSTFATSADAAEPATAAPPAQREKFHLYLLIGQSNMAGRGAVEEVDRRPHPRVLTFTRENAWAPAVDPLHSDKPTAGVGLGSSFGRAMADADPSVTIGLIPCAVGGTPLARWSKGGDLYQQAVARTQAALQHGELKGILWHQGEGDSRSEETARSYGERLAKMVVALRAELKATDVPFVAGKLGEFLKPKPDAKAFYSVVNEQIDLLPTLVARTAVVSSKDLQHHGDGVHFDSPSLHEFGRRYAAAMQKLQATKSPR